MSLKVSFSGRGGLPTKTTAKVSGRHGMLDCTGCAKAALITIRMRVAGHEIVFRRCARCEANSWQDDAGVLSLDEVLELARAR
jgi:hypothetical protein